MSEKHIPLRFTSVHELRVAAASEIVYNGDSESSIYDAFQQSKEASETCRMNGEIEDAVIHLIGGMTILNRIHEVKFSVTVENEIRETLKKLSILISYLQKRYARQNKGGIHSFNKRMPLLTADADVNQHRIMKAVTPKMLVQYFEQYKAEGDKLYESADKSESCGPYQRAINMFVLLRRSPRMKFIINKQILEDVSVVLERLNNIFMFLFHGADGKKNQWNLENCTEEALFGEANNDDCGNTRHDLDKEQKQPSNAELLEMIQNTLSPPGPQRIDALLESDKNSPVIHIPIRDFKLALAIACVKHESSEQQNLLLELMGERDRVKTFFTRSFSNMFPDSSRQNMEPGIIPFEYMHEGSKQIEILYTIPRGSSEMLMRSSKEKAEQCLKDEEEPSFIDNMMSRIPSFSGPRIVNLREIRNVKKKLEFMKEDFRTELLPLYKASKNMAEQLFKSGNYLRAYYSYYKCIHVVRYADKETIQGNGFTRELNDSILKYQYLHMYLENLMEDY